MHPVALTPRLPLCSTVFNNFGHVSLIFVFIPSGLALYFQFQTFHGLVSIICENSILLIIFFSTTNKTLSVIHTDRHTNESSRKKATLSCIHPNSISLICSLIDSIDCSPSESLNSWQYRLCLEWQSLQLTVQTVPWVTVLTADSIDRCQSNSFNSCSRSEFFYSRQHWLYLKEKSLQPTVYIMPRVTVFTADSIDCGQGDNSTANSRLWPKWRSLQLTIQIVTRKIVFAANNTDCT